MELIETLLNNTAPPSKYEELGLLQFTKLFPERITSKSPYLHYEIAILLFQLLDPNKDYSFERRRYLLVHREAAKSTFGSFMFPMFLTYLKGHTMFVRKSMLEWDLSGTYKDFLEDYLKTNKDEAVPIKIDEGFILIVSETARRAERFVNAMKQTIEQRSDLAKLFGEKDPRALEMDADENRKTGNTWRLQAIITADDTVIFGIGSGQRVRGENESGKRPSLVIVDDMYSKQNTKTETTRDNVSYWFNSELMNSIDSVKGKLLWLGTLVHPDTVVEEFKTDEDFKGINRPWISMEELTDTIKLCSRGGTFAMPTKDWCFARQSKLKSLTWPDRHTLYSIVKQYSVHKMRGQLNGYYQEYMNQPIAPENKSINPDTFLELDTVEINKRLDDYNIAYNQISFDYNKYHWEGEVRLNIGVDPASSTNNKSDDTVITVAGLCKVYPVVKGIDIDLLPAKDRVGRVFPVIAHIEGGKYSIHDYSALPGMAEALDHLSNKFVIDRINIEAMGQQEQIVREIRRHFDDKANRTVIWSEYNTMQKEERIGSILNNLIHRYKHFVCVPNSKINTLYQQLIFLGMFDHDDYPDALAIAFKRYEMPKDKPVKTYFSNGSDTIKNKKVELAKELFGNDYMYYL